MEIRWRDERWADGSTRPTAWLTENPSWTLFDRIATELEQQLEGTWSAQLDGFDQRYWDLDVRQARITLHLEHYLGICLYVARDAPSAEDSGRLLQRACHTLADFDPVRAEGAAREDRLRD